MLEQEINATHWDRSCVDVMIFAAANVLINLAFY